ncbi:hypothetical protein D3C87_1588530 [compost metagenome]
MIQVKKFFHHTGSFGTLKLKKFLELSLRNNNSTIKVFVGDAQDCFSICTL